MMIDSANLNESFLQYKRKDGRKFDTLRAVKITPHVVDSAEGSVMIEFGNTRVICTATAETKSPPWLYGTGQGWVTAEYGMLPRSTNQRIKREKSLNGGRTQEISRLIGRSLRAAVDLKLLGEKQIIIDCDVINADGGTRTASITGGFVALGFALQKLLKNGDIKAMPLKNYVAAISVGLDHETPLLDLNYEEDSKIHTDMNFVLTDKLQFIEIQGTAESSPFTDDQLLSMMSLAKKGCNELFEVQKQFVQNIFSRK